MKSSINFKFEMRLYGDDLPEVEISTGKVIDILLDTAVKYPNVMKDVQRVIKNLVNPAKVETEASQYDIILWFNNKLVLCYEDNDFHEVELKVAKPLTIALKKVAYDELSDDEVKIFRVQKELASRRVKEQMDLILNAVSSEDFINMLNNFDFGTNKDINLGVQGENK